MLSRMISNIEELLQEINSQYPLDSKDVNKKSIEFRDYDLTCIELNNVLAALRARNEEDAEIDSDSIKPLTDFFARRAKRLHHSRLCWNLNWISPANQLVSSLAKRIQPDAKKILVAKNSTLPWLAIMCPDLESLSSKLTGKSIVDMRPWQWIVGEDNKPIILSAVFERASKDSNGKYQSTAEKVDLVRDLSATEIEWVKSHSAIAEAYAKAIASKDAAAIERVKAEFATAQNNQNYVVRDIFGKKGEDDLEKMVLHDALIACKSQPDRVASFLKGADDMALKQVAGVGERPIKKLKATDLITEDEQTDRLKLACLAEKYRRDLILDPSSHKTFVAKVTNTGFTLEEKSKTVDEFQAYIVSGKPLRALRQYFSEYEDGKYFKALFDEGWVWNGKICDVVKLAEELGKKYEPEPVAKAAAVSAKAADTVAASAAPAEANAATAAANATNEAAPTNDEVAAAQQAAAAISDPAAEARREGPGGGPRQ